MPRQITADEQACEVVACAQEIERIASRLSTYDAVENRAHRALSMNGRNAAEIIAALVRGDDDEAKMLAELRRDARTALAEARRLAGRIVTDERQMELLSA